MGISTHRLLRHSSIYALGNVLKNIIGFIMLPLYTRYLTPADYGVISLMIVMLSLMELLFAGRLGYALPKMYSESNTEQQRKTLISTALIFMAVVGILIAPAIFLTRFSTSRLVFGTTAYSAIVGYFSFLLLTQSVESVGFDYIRLQQRPWQFLGMTVLKLAIQLSLNIWLIVGMKLGVAGVALSTVGASTAMAGVLLLYTVLKTGLHYDRALALRMLAFSWPMWLGGLAGLYTGSANRYYLRVFSSIDNVGLYALAERFSGIMLMLIWQPFSQYWMVESFNYHQQENTRAFRVVFSVATAMLFVAGLAVSLLASPVIHVMTTHAFYPAAYAVPLLVLGTILGCLSNFVSFSFLVTENTRLLSLFSYLTAVFVSILYLALIPNYGYIGAAAALVGAQGFLLAITYIYGRRRYDMGLAIGFLLTVLMIASTACVLGGFTYSGTSFIADLAIRIACWLGATALIVYLLLNDANIRGYALELLPDPLRKPLTHVLRSSKALLKRLRAA
jgi:O-antigen/teichoic acid export membrane protein